MAGGSEKEQFVRGLTIGLIAGVVGGAAAALLLAPKSGKELRQDIRSHTDAALTRVGLNTPEDKDPWLMGDAVDDLALGKQRQGPRQTT